MSNARPATKKFAIGETVIKSGSKTENIYVLQTGKTIVNLSKEGIVELLQAQAPQVLGDEAVFGSPLAQNSVIAVEPTEVLELPAEQIKGLVQKAAPQMQMILKGLSERVKLATSELKTIKLNQEASPCPPDYTAKVFGVIFHAARYTGKKADGMVEAQWSEFKDYAVGLMEESEYRIRQALNILAKLGYVELDLDGKGILQFTDMTQIEAFFEFYQNYHFKSGYAQFLKTNDKITAITEAVLKVAADQTPDRMGIVRMPFKPTIDALKEILGKTFEADHLFRLETKGLMIKRIAAENGGVLSFWKAEFEQMLLNWKVLREIELWNEKGYVDMTDYVPGRAKAQAQAANDAATAEFKRVAEKLSNWQPVVLRGKAPVIRTEPPKPNELLCKVCLSPYVKHQKVCDVCDSDL